MPPRDGLTGRYLMVIGDDRSQAEDTRTLADAGFTSVHSAEVREKGLGESVLAERSVAVVYDRLGVAVLNPESGEQISEAMAVSRAQDARVSLFEPERFVYALGGDFASGFRAGVNALADAVVEHGGQSPRAATRRTIAYEDSATATWGVQAVGAPEPDGHSEVGSGASVAVLDTGLADHPDVDATSRATFVAGGDALDHDGHGTHCCGTVAGSAQPVQGTRFGVAPGVLLYSAKVLDDDGRGTDSSILDGIEWALENNVDVISMSLGSFTTATDPPSPVYSAVARRALASGTLIVAAAGNDSARPGSVAAVARPANSRGIVAVAAVDKTLEVASFSNAGPVGAGKVMVAGPGVDVLSARIGGGTLALSGTSMATPHVAGVAAAISAETGLRGSALALELLSRAQGLNGLSADVGVGLVQL